MANLRIPPARVVAVAYLKALLDTESVDAVLPTTFADTFLTVLTVGGIPAQESGLREAVVTVDCWAAGGTQARPRWAAAEEPMDRLEELTIANRAGILVQPFAPSAASYRRARVFATTRLLTVPRRVEGDPSGYARITADLALDWTLD